MPRPKPKEAWSARTELPENPYSDDDMKRIVEAAERNGYGLLSTSDRQRLLNLVRDAGRAFLLATHQHLGPTPKQIKAVLREVHRNAEKLSRTISALDEATVFAFLRQHGEIRKAYLDAQGRSSQERFVNATRIVTALVAESEAATEDLGKPRSPEDENPLDWIIDWEFDPLYSIGPPVDKFIIQITEIYHEITGKEPECKHDRIEDAYSGSFLEFADACLKPLEGVSRKALGRKIQNLLPRWREAHDLKV